MRDLTFQELAMVNGAARQDVNVGVIDYVGAAQTFLLLVSSADQKGFIYGSVVTGMTFGAIAGGFAGYAYGAAAGGMMLGCAGALGAGAAGLVVGGIAFKGAAMYAATAYNWIMG